MSFQCWPTSGISTFQLVSFLTQLPFWYTGLWCLQVKEFPGLFTVVACGYPRGPTGGISLHAGHARAG